MGSGVGVVVCGARYDAATDQSCPAGTGCVMKMQLLIDGEPVDWQEPERTTWGEEGLPSIMLTAVDEALDLYNWARLRQLICTWGHSGAWVILMYEAIDGNL